MTVFEEAYVWGHSYVTGSLATSLDSMFVRRLRDSLGGYSRYLDEFDTDSARVIDTFSRIDTPGSTESPAIPWVEQVGDWATDGSDLYVATSGGAINIVTADTGMDSVDGFVMEITSGGIGNTAGILLCYVDLLNYIKIFFSPSLASITVQKVVGGAATTLGSFSFVSAGAGTQYVFAFRGSRLDVAIYIFGVLAHQGHIDNIDDAHTFAGCSASTKHGFFVPASAVATTKFRDVSYSEPLVPGATQLQGYWGIRSGAVCCIAPAASNHNLLVWDFGESDYAAEMVMAGTMQHNMGLAARVQDPANYYRLRTVPAAFAQAEKIKAGVITNENAGVLWPLTGSRIRADALADRIRFNTGAGSEYDVITDPDFDTATKWGLFVVSPRQAPFAASIEYERELADGNGGSQVSVHSSDGSFVEVLQRAPRFDETCLVVDCSGINDMPLCGNARGLLAFKQGYRTVIARELARDVFEDDDASVAYSPGDWTLVPATDRNSGDSYHEGDGTVTITVPGTYASEVLQLGFVTVHDDGGGTGDIKVDGVTVASVSTNGVWTGNSFFGAETVRLNPDDIAALSSGGHTITIVVTSGTLMFDYWALEHKTSTMPKVAVCKVAHLVNYGGYGLGFGTGSAIVTAMNEQLVALEAEFGGKFVLVDIDTPLGADPINFGVDGVHPNNAGHALIAAAIRAAVVVYLTTIAAGREQRALTPVGAYTPDFYPSKTFGPVRADQ